MSVDNPHERAEDRGQESLRVMIARIDERTLNTNKLLESQCSSCKVDMEKHGNRLGSLENDRAKVWAGATVISFIIGLFIKFFKG